jgi:betaine-aldehyde dehydrogenase
MNTVVAAHSLASTKLNLPTRRGAYYGGKWHEPRSGHTVDQINPGTGESLGALRLTVVPRTSTRR